jgi:hypothetical protein
MELVHKPPSPSGTLEALKALGYTLKTAIADLIDNSITAEAKNIWINFFWDGEKSYISLLDDGVGMTNQVLDNAMTPGFQNPNDQRDESDLGRFSLGLKTASWSQSHLLSVWTKSKDTPDEINSMAWDIDLVIQENKWICKRNLDVPNEMGNLSNLASGTLVKWEKLHTPLFTAPTNSIEALEQFHFNMRVVEKYLGMVFHRFIEGSVRYNKNKGPLNIFINNVAINPWNPFKVSQKIASIPTPIDSIECSGSNVEIKGFTLPHKELLSKSEFLDGGGPDGWLQQQGFYIYRGDRLLVGGGWLGLRSYGGRPWTTEEQYKLARLSVDISNSLDKTWQIDLMKTIARPPHFLIPLLTKQAEAVRESAKKAFSHRGEYGPRQRKVVYQERVWDAKNRGTNLVYKINKKHPMISSFYEKLGVLSSDFETVLTLVEECVPVQKIWLDTADQKEPVIPYDGLEKELKLDIVDSYNFLKKNMPISEIADYLKAVEPFSRYPEIVDKVISGL